MSIRSLYRGPTQKGYPSAGSAPLRVDSTTGQISTINAGTGAVEVALLAAYKPNAAITTATHTPAQKDSGLILYYSAVAGITVTLPAATGTGARYKYVRTVDTTSVGDVFKVANATDFMRGFVVQVAKDDGLNTLQGTVNTQVVATESDTYTLPFSTTGPFAGDWVEFIDIATAIWLVSGFYSIQTTEASPFTAAQ